MNTRSTAFSDETKRNHCNTRLHFRTFPSWYPNGRDLRGMTFFKRRFGFSAESASGVPSHPNPGKGFANGYGGSLPGVGGVRLVHALEGFLGFALTAAHTNPCKADVTPERFIFEAH